MKHLQTKITCIKENEITAEAVSGYPSSQYPNSDQYCYHDFFELEYFEAGKGIHYINGLPYEVKPGYLYLLFPGDSHHINLEESVLFRLYNLKLDIKVPDKDLILDLQEYRRPLCVYLQGDDCETVVREFEFLLRILKQKLYNQRMVRNVAERILNLLLCALENGEKANTNIQNEPIWEIIKFSKNHYNEDIRLAELAQRMNISENYIGTYFKKHTGMTFVNYLNRTRLFHGITLLKETNLSIKEIAFAVGFHSPEYFTRLFVATFSKTPKEYRKANKL